MNVWECDIRDCPRKCYGTGGAVGLRAIGWFFEIGGRLRCPAHRPDSVKCRESDQESCSLCAGEIEADRIQETLMTDEDRARRAASVELVFKFGFEERS